MNLVIRRQRCPFAKVLLKSGYIQTLPCDYREADLPVQHGFSLLLFLKMGAMFALF